MYCSSTSISETGDMEVPYFDSLNLQIDSQIDSLNLQLIDRLIDFYEGVYVRMYR